MKHHQRSAHYVVYQFVGLKMNLLSSQEAPKMLSIMKYDFQNNSIAYCSMHSILSDKLNYNQTNRNSENSIHTPPFLGVHTPNN